MENHDGLRRHHDQDRVVFPGLGDGGESVGVVLMLDDLWDRLAMWWRKRGEPPAPARLQGADDFWEAQRVLNSRTRDLEEIVKGLGTYLNNLGPPVSTDPLDSGRHPMTPERIANRDSQRYATDTWRRYWGQAQDLENLGHQMEALRRELGKVMAERDAAVAVRLNPVPELVCAGGSHE